MENDKQFEQQLAAFLKDSQPKIVQKWLNIAKLSKEDPYYEEIINNGKRTVELISHFILTEDESWIVTLTKKIATERIQANVNIGEFVANINSGRSVVISVLNESEFNRDDLSRALDKVNDYFNSYLYHSVTEYTKQKDSIIQDKNLFIKEMHSDRLTILGQLGASFAHEFRNPLTSIKGFLKLLEGQQHETLRNHYFEIINEEMNNLEEKVRQFLFLSKMRGIDDTPSKVNMTSLLEYSVEVLYPRFLESNIEVITTVSKELFVCGVEEQLKQVVLNIMINSIEELSENDQESRKIVVEGFKEGEWVITQITNNGEPIPSHLVESIFEPFISTKELGTGLGLSVCKQIIEKHNGSISVRSNEDETTFVIKLPENC